MRLEALQEALRHRPFRPFRLFVTDGGTYDVQHPELVMAGHRVAIIGMPPAGSSTPIMDRFAIVDLAHVTRLEPLAPSPTSGNGS